MFRALLVLFETRIRVIMMTLNIQAWVYPIRPTFHPHFPFLRFCVFAFGLVLVQAHRYHTAIKEKAWPEAQQIAV